MGAAADARQRRRSASRARFLGDETFVIVNGDTLTDVDLALCWSHAPAARAVTLALVPNREPDKYGGVVLDATDA